MTPEQATEQFDLCVGASFSDGRVQLETRQQTVADALSLLEGDYDLSIEATPVTGWGYYTHRLTVDTGYGNLSLLARERAEATCKQG